MKANQLFNNNNCQGALEHVNKTIAAQMNNWEAYQLRAKIYECLRKYDKSISDYSVLILWQPENVEFLFSRGELRYKEEHYQLALVDLKKALSLPLQETTQVFFSTSPGDGGISGISTIATMQADIHNFIGLCHHELAQYDSAIHNFTSAITLKKDARFFNNRAITYESLKEWPLAIKDYEHAVQLNRGDEIAKYNLVLAYGKMGELEKQKDLLYQLGSVNKLPEIYIYKGVNAFSLNKYDLAISNYDSAIFIDNDNPDYFIYRGQAYEKSGQSRLAKADFQQALLLNPSIPSAYFGLGNTYYRENKLDSARIFYDLAILYDSAYYKAYLNRAIIYLRLGENKKACADLEIAKKGGLAEADDLIEKRCKANPEK